MYLITLMIIVVLNVDVVEPGSLLETLGIRKTKDAPTEANDRFMGFVNPSDDKMAFDAAEEALIQLEAESKSKEQEDAMTILGSYAKLKNVYESLKSGTVDCNSAGAVDEFYKLHESMLKHNMDVEQSKKLQKRFPLSANFLDMRKSFLNHCGQVLSEKLGDLTRSDKLINGVQMSDAFELMKVFRWFWAEEDPEKFTHIDDVISGSHRLYLGTQIYWDIMYDGLEAFADSTRSSNRKKAERMNLKNLCHDARVVTPRLFESTCDVVEQFEPFVQLADTLFKMMKMTERSYDHFYDEERAIIDYVVCQEARTIYFDDELDLPQRKVLATNSGD